MQRRLGVGRREGTRFTGGELMILLRGIVGSTAYGLAREGSDVDRLGVFVAPTVEVAGLDWHGDRESKVTTKPDVTLHEVAKFAKLALKCNPSITEILWLPGEHLEIAEPIFGLRLIGLRDAFLSTNAVRSAYGGYARQQAAKLSARWETSRKGVILEDLPTLRGTET